MATPLKEVKKISFPSEEVFRSAIQEGDTREALKVLDTANARIDLDLSKQGGITALHQSVLNNDLDTVKMLLTQGADPNIADVHGFAPLHTASALGSLEITSLLILFGANIYQQTTDGDLAVDLGKDHAVVRMLHDEMLAQFQRAHFWPSWIVMQCTHVLLFVLRILVLSVQSVINLVRSYVNRSSSCQTSADFKSKEKHHQHQQPQQQQQTQQRKPQRKPQPPPPPQQQQQQQQQQQLRDVSLDNRSKKDT